MAGLLAKLLTTETIPYLPWLVPLVAFVLLVYKGIYKENRDIQEALTGIEAILIIVATSVMAYLDPSLLNITGPFKPVVFIGLQIFGGAIFGGFLAVITNLGVKIIEKIVK